MIYNLNNLLSNVIGSGKKVNSRLGNIRELESVVLKMKIKKLDNLDNMDNFDFYEKLSLNQRFNFFDNDIRFNKIVEYMVCNKDSRRSIFYLSEFCVNEEISCIPLVHFLIRENKLNIHVFARSIDVYNKLENDIEMLYYLANKFVKKYNDIQYFGNFKNYDNIPIDLGNIDIYISSAHVYECDINEI